MEEGKVHVRGRAHVVYLCVCEGRQGSERVPVGKGRGSQSSGTFSAEAGEPESICTLRDPTQSASALRRSICVLHKRCHWTSVQRYN